MLVVDGIRFEEYQLHSEEEFEKEFGDNISNIFGVDSIYFDLKHKLASVSGTGSIPDGYVISLGVVPKIHIVEVELASHSLQHIVAQVINICNGLNNPATQQKICNRIEDEISQKEALKIKIEKAIKPKSIHRFLSDCFTGNEVTLYIAINQNSTQVEEALNTINDPHKIIELQTFQRSGAEMIHAYLFDTIFSDLGKLVYSDNNFEIYEKVGLYLIVGLPDRTIKVEGLKTLDSAKDWINNHPPNGGPGPSAILFLKTKGLSAKGLRTKDGFLVYKGSQAVKDNLRSASPGTVKMRQEFLNSGLLIERVGFLEFTRDVDLKSPSTAGAIIVGGNVNGLKEWKNERGVPLKELEKSVIL